jgi:hypothetical protein
MTHNEVQANENICHSAISLLKKNTDEVTNIIRSGYIHQKYNFGEKLDHPGIGRSQC